MSKDSEDHISDEETRFNKLIREASREKPGELVHPTAEAIVAYLAGTATKEQVKEVREAIIKSEEFAREMLQMFKDLDVLASSEALSYAKEMRRIAVPDYEEFLKAHGEIVPGKPTRRLVKRESFFAGFKRTLWPERSWILRPALLWALILLLAIPAYHGLMKPRNGVITGTRNADVGGDLSGGHSFVKFQPGVEVYLKFDIPESIDCLTCDLVIETDGGKPVLHVEDFASIDRLRVGRIALRDIPPGIYRIIITDPQTDRSEIIHFRAYKD